jgi:SAM-dependent methyltransferase
MLSSAEYVRNTTARVYTVTDTCTTHTLAQEKPMAQNGDREFPVSVCFVVSAICFLGVVPFCVVWILQRQDSARMIAGSGTTHDGSIAAATMHIEDRKSLWDEYYASGRAESTRHDDWFSRHLAGLPAGAAILELGCGLGFVSESLHRAGYMVTATDVAPAALARLRGRVPDVTTRIVDLENRLPFGSSSFQVVIADLCLHYFDAGTTVRVLAGIRRVLVQGGLLARVNSSRDLNHGVGMGKAVEPGFYLDNGHYKRFFDTDTLRELLSGWLIFHMRQYDVHRHEHPKNLIEVVGVRPD